MSKIILDFDGVLFDSAYEAYSVCQNMQNFDLMHELRKDVSYTEFRLYRPKVKNADDFIPLYFSNPDAIDVNKFLEFFFISRKQLMESEDYAEKYYPKFDFLRLILPFMQKKNNCFYILSTRDASSINAALESNGVFMHERIIGQSSIKKYGNKINALKANGVLKCDLYIDDMMHYVNELSEIAELSLMADWGYGNPDKDSISCSVAAKILKSIYFKGI